ncbi:SLC13 family permease [Luteolibacter algae]|uniref:SLC13 family permease n=1 Tax=Luteolibacter algae TaxID=454151 RepID=A0ABW5D9R7_9BACT
MKILGAVFLFVVMAWLVPFSSEGPAMAGLDADSVRIGLAVFFCIAWLWLSEALPLPITALLVPVLGAAAGLTGLKEALAAFSAPAIYLFFGGFALASALSAQGLDLWLAGKLGKLGRGNFISVAVCLFLGTAVLSMWMSNTATAAMMIPLAVGVLNQFRKIQPGEVLPVGNTHFLLLGLAYSASIGGLGTIVGSPPNGIAAKALGISFAGWMKFGIPAVVVLLPVMIAVLYVLLKPARLSIRDGEVSAGCETFEFTRPRRLTLGIFFLTAVAWIFSGKIGSYLGIEDTDTWIALLAVVAISMMKVVSWKEIGEGTDWGVLLLFGGGLAFSGILGASGVSLYLARTLEALLDGWPLWGIVAAVVGFVIFLTELSSNTASAALFVPIFYSLAIAADLPPGKLVLPLALAASCAFMMPVGTPPNAIVYGTGRIEQRAMIRVGFALNLLFIVLITIFGMLFL